jgi:hypothetical protein
LGARGVCDEACRDRGTGFIGRFLVERLLESEGIFHVPVRIACLALFASSVMQIILSAASRMFPVSSAMGREGIQR